MMLHIYFRFMAIDKFVRNPRYTLFRMHFRFMAVIFDSPLTHTSDSIHTSLVVLPDTENMGIAVGISLLSRIQAEINIISYALPVHGGHLWFPTYPYVGQYSH